MTFGAIVASGARIFLNCAAIEAWENSSARHCFPSCRVESLGLTSRCLILRPVQPAGKRAFWPRTNVGFRKASPGCGALGAARAGLVQKVSAKELDQLLASKRSQPLVVDFYATWCGPCIYLAKELDTLAEQYGDNVRFLKVDTEEEYELAQQMKIRALPTMVFVSPDPEKLAIRVEGLLMPRVISDIIEKEL